MLYNLVLLQEPYIYEIAFDVDADINVNRNIICGKNVTAYSDVHAITPYKFGKKHGIQKFYNDDGKVNEKCTYKYGVLHGWYFDKTNAYRIISGKYAKGLKAGLWKYEYQDCTTVTIEYVDDHVNGWVKHYSFGILQLQGKRIGETRVGKWCYFDYDGHKTKVEFYKNGGLVKEVTYHANGCQKRETTFDITREYDSNGSEIYRDAGCAMFYPDKMTFMLRSFK